MLRSKTEYPGLKHKKTRHSLFDYDYSGAFVMPRNVTLCITIQHIRFSVLPCFTNEHDLKMPVLDVLRCESLVTDSRCFWTFD